MTVSIKTAQEIEALRVAGRLAAQLLQMIGPHVQPGISTDELNDICEQHTTQVLGGTSAPLGYHGFPKSICTSVNHVVCHGIPNDKPLKKGDIVNVDVTVIKDDYHGDTSAMFYVGEPSIQARRLCETSYEALWVGIDQVRPGMRLGDLGHAIQTYAEARNYSIVREYCGHGIGRRQVDGQCTPRPPLAQFAGPAAEQSPAGSTHGCWVSSESASIRTKSTITPTTAARPGAGRD